MRMPMKVRSAAVLTVAAAVAATALLVPSNHVSAARPAEPDSPARAAEPAYTFVAAPDFLNQDVGDVRRLPGWDPGDPNPWTPGLQESIDVFLDEIADQHPHDVLVAGDLVEGHWTRDVANTGIFGPDRTTAQKARLMWRAGTFFRRAWVKRFTDRGLRVRAAVGDHDIGDNPWSGRRNRFKRDHLGEFRRLFARFHTRTAAGGHRYASRPKDTEWEDTAYSVRLAPDVLLVTLDVFHRTSHGVRTEVVGGQLAWLRNVLRRARKRGTRWIIVQGHTPILTPVRARSSSRLSLRGGARSPLWRTMRRFGVDLYLAGEVHDTTMRRANGVTQISTGGLLYLGQATYMTAQVYDDHIDFDVREFDSRPSGEAGKLWQVGNFRTSARRILVPGSHSVGTLTLTRDDRVTRAEGKLAAYRP
jgi:hypothetical protein